jgi:predicted O-linked N-acetylglucosamine transferase (SPINDLY family)
LPDPGDPRSLAAAAWRLIERQEFAAALPQIAAACRAAPDDSAVQFLRGVCHHALGHLTHALEAFDRAASLDSGHRDARQAAVAVLCELGRAQEALPRCEQLIAEAPDDADVRFNTGLVHEALGNAVGAIARYEEALARDPKHRPALLNRGLLLTRLGRLEDAHANNRAAAAAYPDLADSHYNLAEVALALRLSADALEHCARALTLDPRHLGALFDRTMALAALGRFDDARAAWTAARAVDAAAFDTRWDAVAGRNVPPRFSPETVHLSRIYAGLQECDWSARERFMATVRELANDRPDELPTERGLAFAAATLPLDAGERLAVARAVSAQIERGVGAALPRRRVRTDGKLRIGYLSADFREHVTARVARPLFAHRDSAAFETYAYSLAPDDGSRLRRTIESSADAFRDLSDFSNRAAAETIARDEIDILVDLGGYTDGARTEIMALHPAAVQVNYLGFPATMGADFIEYAVTDRGTTPPGAERWWQEQLVFLPDTWFLYQPDAVDPALAPSRRDYGLPGHAVVFCALHSAHKIGPEAFAAWLQIVRAVPKSVLWLADNGASCRANLEREATAAGVDPARLIIAPREPLERHLARLARADVFLDAFDWGAITGACDALWMGLPVVTRSGEAPAARTGAGMLGLAGVPELAADGTGPYVALAIRLATDPGYRAAMRARLLDGRTTSRLFDCRGRVRYLEAAYRQMAAQARAGLPPASFEVPQTAAP